MGLSNILKAIKYKFDLKTLIVCSALGLSACSTTPQTLPSPRLVYTCPRVPVYTQDVLDEARAETIAHANEIPVLIGMIQDWSGFRDGARVCQKDAQAISLPVIPANKQK